MNPLHLKNTATKPIWATHIAINKKINTKACFWVGCDKYAYIIDLEGKYGAEKIYASTVGTQKHITSFERIVAVTPKLEPVIEVKAEPEVKVSKYHRLMQSQMPPVYDDKGNFLGIMCDFYDVAEAFDPENRTAAEDHALKKLILPGKRGAKDVLKDLSEVIWSLQAGLRTRISRAKKETYLNKK